MEMKLLIPSVYCESVIQYSYTLTSYRAGVLLCYYRTGMPLPLAKGHGAAAPLFRNPWLSSKNICLPAWCPSG